MSIKLVAIDMDGTLLNDNHEINQPVIDVIKKARAAGIHVVLSTGRPFSGTKAYLETLEMNNEDDFVITYNGGLVLNAKTWETVAEHSLTREDFLEIDHLARKLGVHLHAADKEAMYTTNRDISPYTVMEAFLVNLPLHYRAPEEIAKDFVPIKMMMIDEPEILSEAYKKIPADFFERYTIVRSTPYFVELLNPTTNKGSALKELSEYLGLDPSEVMAIGDAENDLTMIEFAGTGVAMGNSSETIKAAADYTVATNLENGVKEAFDRWVLK